MRISVLEEFLPFDHLSIDEFVHSKPLLSNKWMDLYETYTQYIYESGVVMHMEFRQYVCSIMNYCPLITKMSMNCSVLSSNLVSNR